MEDKLVNELRSSSQAVFGAGTLVPEAELRRWLGRCGRGVRIFQGARLVTPEVIGIGDRTQLDEGIYLFGGDGIELGCHVHFAFGSSVSGGGRCVVGDFVGVAAGARLITGTDLADGTGLTNPTVPPHYRAVRRGHVRVGDHVLVFTNAVVLPDVTIGEGAVVAAGSVVHYDLEPWAIYAGTPLRRVGVRPRERVLEQAEQLRREWAGQPAFDRGAVTSERTTNVD